MPNRKMQHIIKGHSLFSVDPETTIRNATILMAENSIGALVIMDAGNLIGIFTERDLITRVVAPGVNPDTTKIGDVMTPNPITVTAEDPVRRALGMMKMNNLRHLVVVEGDRAIGMVSMRDFVGREIAELDRQSEFEDQIWETAG